MKKLFTILSICLVIFSVSGCGNNDTAEEKQITNVESSGQSDNSSATTNDDETTTEEETEVNELNMQIVDNDNITATLVSIEHVVDTTWDEESYEVKFDVLNKRADTIIVQAREVSSDGKMIDDSMLMMSQEIASGKRADCVLEIQNYDGDLPSMESDFEMLLHIFSWDNYDYSEDHKVQVTF